MPTASRIVLGAVLLTLLPAQAQRVAGQAKTMPSKGGFSLETGEACSGLSHEECCGQKLELASFRAQGDYLSGPIKTTVQLACRGANHVVSPQVCRSIAVSRGFTKDADAICKSAQHDCQKDGACRQCTADLTRLDYQGSHNVCHALTYVPPRAHARVIIVRTTGGTGDDDRGFVLRRRQPSP